MPPAIGQGSPQVRHPCGPGYDHTNHYALPTSWSWPLGVQHVTWGPWGCYLLRNWFVAHLILNMTSLTKTFAIGRWFEWTNSWATWGYWIASSQPWTFPSCGYHTTQGLPPLWPAWHRKDLTGPSCGQPTGCQLFEGMYKPHFLQTYHPQL